MESSAQFFSNSACAYFPCHPVEENTPFNCLFCYCPLYALGRECGGDFTILEGGIKDCSGCIHPHKAETYPQIVAKLGTLQQRFPCE